MKKVEVKGFRWEEWIPFGILCLSIPLVAIYYYKFEFIWSKQASSNLSLLIVLLFSIPLLMKRSLEELISLDFFILLLLTLWAGLSSLWAIVPHKVFKMSTMLCAGVAGFGLAKTIVRDKDKAKWFILSSILTGVFISIYGILQFHIDSGFFEMPRDQYGEKDPVTTYGLSNFTVDVLVVIFPLGIGLFFSTFPKILKVFGILSILIILYYILISRVRAGYTAVIVMTLFILSAIIFLNREFLKKYKREIGAIVGAVVISSALFFSFTRTGRSIVHTFLSSFDLSHSSVQIRIHAWKQALGIIKDNPVIGVGLGNYEVVSWKYQDAIQEKMTLDSNTRVDKTHNEYINVTCDLGFIGLIMFLGFFATLLLKGLIFMKNNSSLKEDFWLVCSLSAGVIGELVDATFTFPFQMPGSIHHFFITSGALSGLMEIDQKISMKDPAKRMFSSLPLFMKGFLKYSSAFLCLFTLILAFIWNRNFTLSEVNYRIGQLLKRQGRLGDSLLFFERGLKYEPFAERIYYDRAFVLAKLGQVNKAAESMKNCLKEVPYFGKARKEYAMFLSEMGQYEQALEEFTKALENHRYAEGEIRYYMANILLRRNTPQLALEEILKAMKEGARDAGVLNVLAHSLYSLGRKDLGLSVMRQAVLISGKEYAPVASLATYFSDIGEVDEALKLLREAEEELKGDGKYWFLRAVIEQKAGKSSEAEQSLSKSFSLNPSLRDSAQKVPELQEILKKFK